LRSLLVLDDHVLDLSHSEPQAHARGML
jgi:hypothetical protein